MELHEYQAKKLLEKQQIPSLPFFIVESVEEAEKIVRENNLQEAAVKIQVHAGGRGKAGGIKLARTPLEIIEAVKQLLGMKIVNRQTGPDGIVARKVMITGITSITKEYYLGVVIDRKNASTSLIASPAGGIDIEEVAKNTPDKILVEKVFKYQPIRSFQLARICKFLGWQGDIQKQGLKIIEGLISAFFAYDAELLEINPLIETEDRQLIALDAKLSIDDNALFRQKEIANMYDTTQRTDFEVEAQKFELAYVGLDGNIGCMVNGAGLAMATMDLIRLKGGEPANFLDVGGGASLDKVSAGFKILLKDPHVKAILINIFGGIMNCETIALAVKQVVEEVGLNHPLVIRMEGTNVEAAKKIIASLTCPIIMADTLDDAAEKVVEMVC
jgi:succinyl-CoA synthetase beta subunit